MGNSVGRACYSFAGEAGELSKRHNDVALDQPEPLDEVLDFGHSFCYPKPEHQPRLSGFSVSSNSEEDYSSTTTTFPTISGASVSANTSTPLSPLLLDTWGSSIGVERAASFASSASFASTPLQLVPRDSNCETGSGPGERGFKSGPMESFVSGPLNLDPIEKRHEKKVQQNIFPNNGRVKSKKRFIVDFKEAISRMFRTKKLVKRGSGVGVKESNLDKKNGNVSVNIGDVSGHGHVCTKYNDGHHEVSPDSMERKNLQWLQGKAGEDLVQVVISEEHGWLFVGIYDGFNGPDAPEFLITNLYSAVHNELEGLLWNKKVECTDAEGDQSQTRNSDKDNDILGSGELDLDLDSNIKREQGNSRSKGRSGRVGSFDIELDDGESIELDRKLKKQSNPDGLAGVNHSEVLKALSEALRKTEDAYLKRADEMVSNNPELALMGSCVLVMLMKGEDVYLMNVGDSRAVLAQEDELDRGPRKMHQDLKRMNEEILSNQYILGGVGFGGLINSISIQLTTDHSTDEEEEVQRIRNDHPDDASAVINDRVKGYLKVTRAFGAGFLKEPKWNDALLEMFRIDYIGTSPYITCCPSLYHYRLGPRDRFLILSSDGLYQYFTNEEAVAQVESFIASFPDGDPAKHLIEVVLFRAAKKAGMDFHELLDIPQGERRRYHDDVSVIVVSLEGRIWQYGVPLYK